MRILPQNIEKLIAEFSRLPGIGPKLAQRLTLSLLKGDDEEIQTLGAAVTDLKEGIVLCKNCHLYSENELCGICSSSGRDNSIICVVEDPLDVVAIEKTGRFNGLYHVLHGALSPVEGIGPDELKFAELEKRISDREVSELIIATNPSLEGEATGLYIQRLLKDKNIIITRIAAGLPMGGDLEYADELTLSRALEGRRPL